MPKRTNLVEPHELCDFAERHYNISDDLAYRMTWWVTPECEVTTRDYSIKELQIEMANEPEEEGSYSEYPATPRQMLIDYMTANNITSMTLTQ